MAGTRVPWLAVLALAAAGVAALLQRWGAALVASLVALGVVGALFLDARHQATAGAVLPAGQVALLVEALADASGGPGQDRALVRVLAIDGPAGPVSWNGPAGRLRGGVAGWTRDSRWWIETTMHSVADPVTGHPARDPLVWEGRVARARPAPEGVGWMAGQAARVRSIIIDRLRPGTDRGRALLAGFLLGDVSHLRPWEEEAMRRAGLSHFVAVSGSNVALFLGALFLVAGPLGWSSIRRAILGLAGLAFFVLLIGPDPSVVRAATMAGLVLLARPFGLRPDIWRVIGVGVGLLLLVSPELAHSLGFQLSVAATAGVVIGTGWFPNLRPRWLATSLGAACGAQLAVAPILLLAIGQLPLWSPVANVVAAPLVVAATGLGGAGAVTGLDVLVEAGALPARAVLGIADLSSTLPQIGWTAAVLFAGCGLVALARRFRPVAVLAASLLACSLTIFAAPHVVAGAPVGPAFVALDVGQGDALLLLGEAGETVLVDGGSDGAKVRAGLARFGVRAVDLLVVSHAHHDHYGGLADVIGALPVGQVWYAPFPGQPDEFTRLVRAAEQVTWVTIPSLGVHRIGSIWLEVLGPARRYASPNDQSIAIRATVGGGTVLLSGDMERVSQADLDPPRVDVLKVPHQGAATSDPEWLVGTGASVAVVSVGPNRFGHPSEKLLATLRRAGMEVRRTDREGDVVIGLGL
ncbi:MAG: ComEC/Rec2 family competence protein [bacterium]|nr:ComEC/Rec2 family competence protein [bacterium]